MYLENGNAFAAQSNVSTFSSVQIEESLLLLHSFLVLLDLSYTKLDFYQSVVVLIPYKTSGHTTTPLSGTQHSGNRCENYSTLEVAWLS